MVVTKIYTRASNVGLNKFRSYLFRKKQNDRLQASQSTGANDRVEPMSSRIPKLPAPKRLYKVLQARQEVFRDEFLKTVSDDVILIA